MSAASKRAVREAIRYGTSGWSRYAAGSRSWRRQLAADMFGSPWTDHGGREHRCHATGWYPGRTPAEERRHRRIDALRPRFAAYADSIEVTP